MRQKKAETEPQEKTFLIEELPEEKTKKDCLKICPVNSEKFYPPTKGTEKATCYDVYMPTDMVVHRGMQTPTLIPLGIKLEIPKGYDVRIYLRSSVGRDLHLIMANSVGIIDEDFRGELMAYVYNVGTHPVFLKEKQRIFQIELQKKADYAVEFVSEISEDTERGQESGSTGRQKYGKKRQQNNYD